MKTFTRLLIVACCAIIAACSNIETPWNKNQPVTRLSVPGDSCLAHCSEPIAFTPGVPEKIQVEYLKKGSTIVLSPESEHNYREKELANHHTHIERIMSPYKQ